MMPPQLARAHRPRRSSRPILEQLPAVTTTELRISSLYSGKKRILRPLKIPHLEGVKVTTTRVDFHFLSLHRGQRGRTESFRLKPIPQASVHSAIASIAIHAASPS